MAPSEPYRKGTSHPPIGDQYTTPGMNPMSPDTQPYPTNQSGHRALYRRSKTNLPAVRVNPRRRIPHRLLSLCMGFTLLILTFWDFYFDILTGIRALDFLALIMFLPIILYVVFSCPDEVVSYSAFKYLIMALMATMLTFYMFLGYLEDSENIKSGVGFLLGFSTFYIGALTFPWRQIPIGRILNALLILHSSALLFQFSLHQVSGYLLDFHWLFGQESRLIANITRYSGLFREPATFSFTVVAIIILRFHFGARSALDVSLWIGVFSIFVSQSLWGLVTSIAVITIWLLTRVQLLPAITIFVVLSTMYFFFEEMLFAYSWGRLIALDIDSSAAARYEGLFSLLEGSATDTSIWFGNGLGYNYLTLGSNGFSYLISGIGIVGTVHFFIGLWVPATSRDILRRVLSSAFLLTAAPLWGTFFVWIFFGMLIQRKEY